MKLVSTVDLFTLQVRVLLALILRETRATFGTSNLGYIWAIVTPTASVALLVYIFSLVDREPPFGPSLALFFATGILTLQFFNELSSKLLTVFDANRALLTYPVIKDVDTLIARTLLITITYLLIFAIFFSSLIVLGLANIPSHMEHVLFSFFATALLGFAIGATNAAISSVWDTWRQIEKVFTRPLFFLSGIFYVPSNLPPEVIEVLKWNPVLHLVEWLRHGFYPNYNSLVLNIWYPIYLGLGLLLVGLSGERMFRKMRF